MAHCNFSVEYTVRLTPDEFKTAMTALDMLAERRQGMTQEQVDECDGAAKLAGSIRKQRREHADNLARNFGGAGR